MITYFYDFLLLLKKLQTYQWLKTIAQIYYLVVQEVRCSDGSHRAKIKGINKFQFLSGGSEENLFSRLCPDSRGCHHIAWDFLPFSICMPLLKAIPHCHLNGSFLPVSIFSIIRMLVITLNQTILDDFPISMSAGQKSYFHSQT